MVRWPEDGQQRRDMPEIIDIRTCDDPRDEIHRVVEHLAAGELVGLPTETSYVVAAQAARPAAVERLKGMAGGDLVMAVKTADEALDYAPAVDGTGERLFRRLWPGPVIIEVPVGTDGSLAAALHESTRVALARHGAIRLRVPEHDVVNAVQRLAASPLVLAGEADGIGNPAALLSRYPELKVVIDDGPPLRQGRCTMIRLRPGGWTMVEEGLVSEAEIRDRNNFGVVFVCTGNTCRSPLAEAIFRKMLAERLNCSEEDLTKCGFFITSAGLAAGHGVPAAAESLALAAEFGLDLVRHRSRPLTDDLLDTADYVFTMTAGHRESILSARPELAGRVHLLSREGIDIADPIGGGPAEYERCRAEIERELLVLLERLPIVRKERRD
jgi:L-threonylcarbamoyladenylate synthase